MPDGRPLRGRWSEYRTPGFVPTTFVDEVRHALLTAGEYHVEATGEARTRRARSRRRRRLDDARSRIPDRAGLRGGDVDLSESVPRSDAARMGGVEDEDVRETRERRGRRDERVPRRADVAPTWATSGTDARGRGDAPGRLRCSRRRRGRIRPGRDSVPRRGRERRSPVLVPDRLDRSPVVSPSRPRARRGDPDDLLTAADAAGILHVSTETVYRMLRSHTLPPLSYRTVRSSREGPTWGRMGVPRPPGGRDVTRRARLAGWWSCRRGRHLIRVLSSSPRCLRCGRATSPGPVVPGPQSRSLRTP